MKRRFIDAPQAERCMAQVQLGDGSWAQCGRHKKQGYHCTQHYKMLLTERGTNMKIKPFKKSQASRDKKAKPEEQKTGWAFCCFNPNSGKSWVAAEGGNGTNGDYHWLELNGTGGALFDSPESVAAKKCKRQFRGLDKHLIRGFAWVGPPGPVPRPPL